MKLIKFGDSKKRQAENPVRYKDVIENMVNILIIDYNNCFPSKIILDIHGLSLYKPVRW